MAKTIAQSLGHDVKLDAGEIALDGTNPTVVNTPFTTIEAVDLTIAAATTPGDDVSVLTYAKSGGTLSIYAWVHTATDPTLVASTATHTVSYVVVGH